MGKSFFLLTVISIALGSCGGQTERRKTYSDTLVLAACPLFVADSAMNYIKEQCAFGPRVPGSSASEACGDYLVKQFERFGAVVKEQRVEVTAYDDSKVPDWAQKLYIAE